MEETKQLIKELHKPVAPVKEFRKVVTDGVDHLWGIDLMYMPSPDENDGYKYVFVIEDIFSRFVWVRPLKAKDGTTTFKALESVIDEAGVAPAKLWADQGGEFYNDVWKKGLKKLGITLYSTYSDWGVAHVESVIKTLKNWLMPKYEERGSLRWVELLPETVKYYNTEHIHKALGMTPQQAREPLGTALLKRKPKEPTLFKDPKFKVGDWVRVARAKQIFEKGFDARWSYQPYQVVKVSLGSPVLYYVADGAGEEVKGAFYENELQKTAVRDAVLIQAVLQTKKDKSLVKFRGFPKEFDQWVPNESIQHLKKS